MVDLISTSSGDDALTVRRMNPLEFAPAPLASGEPIVKEFDVWTGGLQDGNAKGAPCVLFGAVHCLKAGTVEARSGDAPLGLTCVALATWLTTMSPSAPRARASGSTIFLLMLI
jgi:hypothetical protein